LVSIFFFEKELFRSYKNIIKYTLSVLQSERDWLRSDSVELLARLIGLESFEKINLKDVRYYQYSPLFTFERKQYETYAVPKNVKQQMNETKLNIFFFFTGNHFISGIYNSILHIFIHYDPLYSLRGHGKQYLRATKKIMERIGVKVKDSIYIQGTQEKVDGKSAWSCGYFFLHSLQSLYHHLPIQTVHGKWRSLVDGKEVDAHNHIFQPKEMKPKLTRLLKDQFFQRNEKSVEIFLKELKKYNKQKQEINKKKEGKEGKGKKTYKNKSVSSGRNSVKNKQEQSKFETKKRKQRESKDEESEGKRQLSNKKIKEKEQVETSDVPKQQINSKKRSREDKESILSKKPKTVFSSEESDSDIQSFEESGSLSLDEISNHVSHNFQVRKSSISIHHLLVDHLFEFQNNSKCQVLYSSNMQTGDENEEEDEQLVELSWKKSKKKKSSILSSKTL